MAIITQDRPKRGRKASAREEDRLRAACVTGFSERYPENRGRLIGTFQEVSSVVEGTMKNSLGLVAGVPDLLWVMPGGLTVGIEMKYPGTSHKTEHLRRQAEWLIKIPVLGWFCDTEEGFWDIILSNGRSGGKTPQNVLKWLENIKTKSVTWKQ